MSAVSSIFHVVINTYRRQMTIPDQTSEHLDRYIWSIVKAHVMCHRRTEVRLRRTFPGILRHQAATVSRPVGFAFLCRDSGKLEQVRLFSRCSIGCMVFPIEIGSPTRCASSTPVTCEVDSESRCCTSSSSRAAKPCVMIKTVSHPEGDRCGNPQ